MAGVAGAIMGEADSSAAAVEALALTSSVGTSCGSTMMSSEEPFKAFPKHIFEEGSWRRRDLTIVLGWVVRKQKSE